MYNLRVLWLIGITTTLSWGDSGQVLMTLLPDHAEVVLGQPLLTNLLITNNSTHAIIVFPTDQTQTLIKLEDDQGHAITLPPPAFTGDSGFFGAQILAKSHETIPVTVAVVAEVRRPGDYSVTVTIPAIGVSANSRVLVRPYSAQDMESWMEQTTRAIIEKPNTPEHYELLKALAGAHSDASERYLCRVVTESGHDDLPIAAIDKLEAIGTGEATGCLIHALSRYQRTDYDYIVASLSRIRAATSNTDVRALIDKALGQQKR